MIGNSLLHFLSEVSEQLQIIVQVLDTGLQLFDLIQHLVQAIFRHKGVRDLEELNDVGLDLHSVHLLQFALQFAQLLLQVVCLFSASVPAIDHLLVNKRLFGRQSSCEVNLEDSHLILEIVNLVDIALHGSDSPDKITLDAVN